MSKLHEIREVYLSDIIKIQKSTKSIVAEELGELQGKEKKKRRRRRKKYNPV